MESLERLHLLQKAIGSLKECLDGVRVAHYVSISFSADFAGGTPSKIRDALLNESTSSYKIDVTIHSEEMLQAARLLFLARLAALDDDSVVMFFRDDDVMLDRPRELFSVLEGKKTSFKSKQLVPVIENPSGQVVMKSEVLERGSREEIQQAVHEMPEVVSKWVVDDTLSGCTTHYSVVKALLAPQAVPSEGEPPSALLDGFLDVTILDAIDAARPETRSRPVVFHRMVSEPHRVTPSSCMDLLQSDMGTFI